MAKKKMIDESIVGAKRNQKALEELKAIDHKEVIKRYKYLMSLIKPSVEALSTGLPKGKLARSLGVTRQTLYRKIDAEFLPPEILEKICAIIKE